MHWRRSSLQPNERKKSDLNSFITVPIRCFLLQFCSTPLLATTDVYVKLVWAAVVADAVMPALQQTCLVAFALHVAQPNRLTLIPIDPLQFCRPIFSTVRPAAGGTTPVVFTSRAVPNLPRKVSFIYEGGGSASTVLGPKGEWGNRCRQVFFLINFRRCLQTNFKVWPTY